jgi:RNA polymerase sigma factor (sigma-70 family)
LIFDADGVSTEHKLGSMRPAEGEFEDLRLAAKAADEGKAAPQQWPASEKSLEYRLAGGEWNRLAAEAAGEGSHAPPTRDRMSQIRACGEESKMRRPASRSDTELFAATPENPQAFGEFYRRHEQAVLRFFLHWTRSGELAADLTAETFAAVFESLPRYVAERGEPRAWLFGIAQNILARSVRRGRVEDETRRRVGLAPVVVDDDALERIEALASQDGSALEALDGLSAALREAVSGRVLEEREYRELAEALNCSQSVVRQRVKRGLSRIRDRLEVKP